MLSWQVKFFQFVTTAEVRISYDTNHILIASKICKIHPSTCWLHASTCCIMSLSLITHYSSKMSCERWVIKDESSSIRAFWLANLVALFKLLENGGHHASLVWTLLISKLISVIRYSEFCCISLNSVPVLYWLSPYQGSWTLMLWFWQQTQNRNFFRKLNLLATPEVIFFWAKLARNVT